VKRRLFDENDRYTQDATRFDQRASRCLQPLIDDAVREGFSVRDVMTLLNLTVMDLGLMAILEWDNPRPSEALTEVPSTPPTQEHSHG
jgi:hypothetical protein